MKNISEMAFRKKMREDGAPERVLLEATHRCNFKCSHCYITGGQTGPEADKAGFTAILRSIADSGAMTIGFTGGEPLMRDDIFGLLEAARDAGFRPLLYTNASLITASKARRLKSLGIAKVLVSMHGATESGFERVTGIKGSFRKTMAGISALRAAGLPLGIKSCAPSLNPGDINRLAEMAGEWGAHLRLSPVILPKMGQRHAGLTKEIKLRTRGDGRIPSIFPPCGAALTQCAVTPSLRLKPCPAIHSPSVEYNGNFRQALGTLSKKWKKQKSGMRKKCLRCEAGNDCARCPAETMPVKGCLP